MKQNSMTETLSLPDQGAERTSLQVEVFPPVQVGDSLDEKKRQGPASAPDKEVHHYVRGWRLRFLTLGSASRENPSSFPDA